MRTAAEIVALYGERAKYYSAMHAGMQEIRAIYNNEIVINLPEMDRTAGSSVPNLLGQGIDQYAGRISQTVPTIWFPPMDSTKRTQVRRAKVAGRVVSAWWYAERFKLKQLQRARHLVAYGIAPCVVRWDPDLHRPVREVRNPLETYPNPETIKGTTVPVDCLFAYRRSVGHLQRAGHGNAITAVLGRPFDPQIDDQMLLLEYIDPDGRMLLLTGNVQPASATTGMSQPYVYGAPGTQRAAILEWAPNKPGSYCCVTIPTRVTLDAPASQFATMIGQFYQAARLMALETIAVEKGIFPDTYAISRPGEIARLVEGPYDGRTGLINVLAGGDIKEVQTAPSYVVPQIADRLERSQRIAAGLPSDFQGESQTNVRTGRRGDALLSAVIDFPIAEAQEIFAGALEDENRIAISLAKTYDGANERTLFVGEGNETRSVTYVANEVFPSTEHRVAYPVSGADVNTLMIGLEQRSGSGTMSKKTVMALDPWVSDPEVEHDRIIVEGLEQALMARVMGEIQQGEQAMPSLAIAKLIQLVGDDRMEFAEALQKVAQDAQDQAQAAPPEGEPPGPPTAEQAAAGPTAAAATGAPIGPPPQGEANLSQLVTALRRPQMAARSMAAGGA